MAETRYYGTGKRKNAVAKVWLAAGDGTISVNKKTPADYFTRATLEALIVQPFQATDTVGRYSVTAQTLGGGIAGQAGALRHGISKALTYYEPELRGVLKKGGFLTRDSRTVERKKYGRMKARRSFQFSKR